MASTNWLKLGAVGGLIALAFVALKSKSKPPPEPPPLTAPVISIVWQEEE